MCYNVYTEINAQRLNEKRNKEMKKYFVVEIEEDMSAECNGSFIAESSEVMCAKSEAEVIRTLHEMLGKHLVTFSIRKATRAERRAYKLTHNICIV